MFGRFLGGFGRFKIVLRTCVGRPTNPMKNQQKECIQTCKSVNPSPQGEQICLKAMCFVCFLTFPNVFPFRWHSLAALFGVLVCICGALIGLIDS